MNDFGGIFFYTALKNQNKKPTQNLACSQRQIHTVHTCKLSLSQAKNYRRTLIPMKHKQPLPTHPFPKVQLYIAVKCRDIYRVTNNDNRKKNHTHTCMYTYAHTLHNAQHKTTQHTQSNYGNVSFTQHTHQRERTYTV